ncbi:hypothetical protein ACJ73_07887 [Blastomyces percursus]|uniref:Uncharacterized protein n=1 Tax=Blastomyces percursus TaxID=1658174 RepID=A0A1J9PWP6_9EURO|nr:hypothetical protein ACJ73_07887 [Blastomyces percursus]
MSEILGNKALRGEWEDIGALKFEMSEDMIVTFEGRSCHIEDSEGRHVDTLGSEDGRVTREVLEGYRCYVLKAKIKFEKRQ